MILTLHPETPQQRHLERIVQLLQKDGVIAYPTDTLYGLGCLMSRKKAVDRINAIKHRDARRPMSILCSSMEMLSRFARHIDTPVFKQLKRMFPGPYTAILPASRDVPRYLQPRQDVGIRIPDQAFCKALVDLLGEPILTTSCNLSGEPPIQTSWEIEAELGHALDLVIDCGEPSGTPSTVVSFLEDEPVLVREGAGIWPL